MRAGTKLHKMHTRKVVVQNPPCRSRDTRVASRRPCATWSVGHWCVAPATSDGHLPALLPHGAPGCRTAPVLNRCAQRILSLGVVKLEPVASEIAKLAGVETRQYAPGERLAPGTGQPKGLHVYIRDGAIALRLTTGRSTSALLEIFGPGRLLSPQLWQTPPGSENRHATALLSTTTFELPADVLEHELAAHPPLALAVVSQGACQQAGSLDRLAMLALRDPLRRVAHTVLLLLERFSGAPDSASSTRLEVGQELIAAFASLSRQTTNRQLRRLARAGVAAVKRRAVDVRDLGALRGVAGGRRSLGR